MSSIKSVIQTKHRWQQMRQSTREWYMAACATFWTLPKRGQVLELDLGSSETRTRERSCAPTLKSGHVTGLLAQWNTLNVGGPHPATHTHWRPAHFVSYSLEWGAQAFEQKKIPTSGSKERTVLWRSSHLHIGVYTFRFWQLHALKEVLISEGSFYVPSVKESHRMCPKQYHVRTVSGTKLLQNFF